MILPEWLQLGFESFSQVLNGTAKSPLHKYRTNAFSKLLTTGFSSVDTESWKYTNLKQTLSREYTFTHQGKKSAVSISEEQTGCSCVFNFEDGILVSAPDQNSLKGIRFSVLTVGSSDAELVSWKQLVSAFPDSESLGFELLNTSFMNQVLTIEVLEGAEVDLPILLNHVCKQDGARCILPRVLIKIGTNASASLYEKFSDPENSEYLTASVIQIKLEANSTLNHYKLQNESHQAIHASVSQIIQEDSSKYKNVLLNLGSSITRNEIWPVINGREVLTELYGANILMADQKSDTYTVIDHAQPDSQSTEIYKGVYSEKSTGIFSGTIIVKEGAQGTNAIQSNKSLIISDDAVSYSRPQLKIWADDVKCTHGATVGQIDEEALFYLKSRGISDKEARKMLMLAFIGEVLAEIEDETIWSEFSQLAEARLSSCYSV